MIDINTVSVTRHNVHIPDSWKVPKSDYDTDLNALRVVYQTQTEVFKRSNRSMKKEWATHDFLYAVGYKPDRTGNLDLNYPQKWYVSAVYSVIGTLVWPFIS